MIIMTIKMRNGWLNKITGSHDNFTGDSFLTLLDTTAAFFFFVDLLRFSLALLKRAFVTLSI